MKISNKDKFFKGKVSDFRKSEGWFVGQFMGKCGHPRLETDEVEVCWKVLEGGKPDPLHFHKKGVEIAIVISGWLKARVNGKEIKVGEREFLLVYPKAHLERYSYKEGTEVVVIKAPSIPGDKFEV